MSPFRSGRPWLLAAVLVLLGATAVGYWISVGRMRPEGAGWEVVPLIGVLGVLRAVGDIPRISVLMAALLATSVASRRRASMVAALIVGSWAASEGFLYPLGERLLMSAWSAGSSALDEVPGLWTWSEHLRAAMGGQAPSGAMAAAGTLSEAQMTVWGIGLSGACLTASLVAVAAVRPAVKRPLVATVIGIAAWLAPATIWQQMGHSLTGLVLAWLVPAGLGLAFLLMADSPRKAPEV